MITKLLFDTEEFEFKAPVPMTEAINNLKSHIKEPSAAATNRIGMVGKISPEDVFIYHVSNSRRSTFTPTFYGRISGSENQSMLSGTISINKVVKKFMLLWIGIVGLIAIATFITLIKNPAGSWLSFAYILLILAAAIGTLIYVKQKAGPAKMALKERLVNAMQNQL